MFGLSAGSDLAHEAYPHPHAEDSEAGDTKWKHPKHGSLGDIGAKLRKKFVAEAKKYQVFPLEASVATRNNRMSE